MNKNKNIKIDPNKNYGYIGAGLLKSSENPNDIYRASLSFWAKNGDQNCVYTSGHLGEMGDVIWFEAEGTWYKLGKIIDKEDDPQTEIDWAIVDTSLLSSNGVNIKFEPTYKIENILGYDVTFTDYIKEEADKYQIQNASDHLRLFVHFPRSGVIAGVTYLGVKEIGEGMTASVYSLINPSSSIPTGGDSGGTLYINEPNGENKIVGIHNGVSLSNASELFMTPLYETGIADYTPITIKSQQPLSKGVIVRTELVNTSNNKSWVLSYFGYGINGSTIDIYGIGEPDSDQYGQYNIRFPENPNEQIFFGEEHDSATDFLNVKRTGIVFPSYIYIDKANKEHILNDYVDQEERSNWVWDMWGPVLNEGQIWTKEGAIYEVEIGVVNRDDPYSRIWVRGLNADLSALANKIKGGLVVWRGWLDSSNYVLLGDGNRLVGIIDEEKQSNVFYVMETYKNKDWMIPYTERTYNDWLNHSRKK